MDFLKYGMEHEKSDSLLHRQVARGVLTAEKKWADLYEAYLNRKEFSFPDGPEEEAALLEKIRARILECQPGGAAHPSEPEG